MFNLSVIANFDTLRVDNSNSPYALGLWERKNLKITLFLGVVGAAGQKRVFSIRMVKIFD
jgi:hypothetical protein